MADLESISASYPLHYHVWNNDYHQLDKELSKNKYDKEAKDPHHRTPLMLAVCLGHIESARVLLHYNANAAATNLHSWSVCQEAVSTGDPEMLKLIHIHRNGQHTQKQAKLIWDQLHLLEKVSDFYVEMKWEFTSWLPMIATMCPTDQCRIYKRGKSLRVDTTLLGVSPDNTWLKGSLTYIFTTNENGVVVEEVNHSQGAIYRHEMRLNQTHEGYLEEAPSDEFIARKLTQPIFVTHVDLAKIEVEKSKSGILGSEKHEDVDGYDCQVFTAHNVQVGTLRRTEHLKERDKARYREGSQSQTFASSTTLTSALVDGENAALLDRSRQFNVTAITAQEYFAPHGDLGLRDIGRPREMTSRIKTFKTHIWLCRDYPLRLREHLMPCIRIMAQHSPYFNKLNEFLQLQLPAGFPLRMEAPLYHILNARITFGNVFACEKTVNGVTFYAHAQDANKEHDLNSIAVTSAKATQKSSCRLDDSVFHTPSVYRIASERSSPHGAGIEEEEQLVEMALQQSLINYGHLDPRSRKKSEEGKRGSLITDATAYYGEEDAMLQRAIEASLCENASQLSLTSTSSVRSDGPDPTDSQVQTVMEKSKRELEREERQRQREEKELERVLELSKHEK